MEEFKAVPKDDFQKNCEVYFGEDRAPEKIEEALLHLLDTKGDLFVRDLLKEIEEFNGKKMHIQTWDEERPSGAV